MPKFSSILVSKFPYQPTEGQRQLFTLFDDLFEKQGDRKDSILIKGYAGTGKTTVVSSLVQVLPLFNYKFVLMAPTGRAAKVLASYSGKTAFTIHKIIYRQVADPESGELKFVRQKNYFRKTVFIIDEASMISDEPDMSGNGLLNDVLSYIFEHKNNKLVMIGDVAQLPPVGKQDSPGLESDYLKNHYGLDLAVVELRDVIRQEVQSGILDNATSLRNLLDKEGIKLKILTKPFQDLFRITAEKLEDGLRYAYDKYGIENTTVICRANWQAVRYNEYIRRQLLFYEEEIEAGDILMVVRNNYYYLPSDSPAGFIANGDFVRVKRISKMEEEYGFRFARVELTMVDFPEIPSFEARIILDTLRSNTPSLNAEESLKLYREVSKNYSGIASKRQFREAIRNDEYLNALQVKFAYALTCHKSQGGQWKVVFLDQGVHKDFKLDRDYIRWLYTAFTRAEKELFLLNFNEDFFR